MEPWIIPVVIAIAAALALYFNYRWEKKRREALAAWMNWMRRSIGSKGPTKSATRGSPS
jgi:hypothetical protein